jgi:hypothetical protein
VNIEALNEYLESKRKTDFVWGSNDCLTFTNGAFHAMYGEGWCDDWLGRYMRGKEHIANDELQSEFGFETLEEGVSSKLTKIDYIAPRGALVTAKLSRRFLLGQAFGISTGTKAAFLTRRGLLYLPVDIVSSAWIKP